MSEPRETTERTEVERSTTTSPRLVEPRHLGALLWLLPLPALGFLLFGSTGRDDAYITYWVADQFRRTGRIANYNGRRLEQSSSLLHVLALGAVSWATRLPVTTIGPWLSIGAGAACVPVAYALGVRLEPRARWIAAALVATLPPLVYWSFGGLETSVATLSVLGALLAIINVVEGARTAVWIVAAAIAAVVLVRPEMGPVFVVALAIAALLVRFSLPDAWRGTDGTGCAIAARRIMVVALTTAGAAIALAAGRQAYFGEWVPRPVLMKTGTPHVGLGLRYTATTLVQSGAVISIGAAAVVAATRRRALTPAWIVAGSLAAVGTLAVIGPGGDWMEGGRLLAPWLAVSVVIVGALVARVPASPRVMLAGLLITANAAGLVNYAARDSTGTAAWSHLVWHDRGSSAIEARCATPAAGWFERRNAKHARDARFVCEVDPIFAELAKEVAPRRLVYESGQAGMVVYYLQRDATRRGHAFSFIDGYGLTDGTWDGCRVAVAATPAGKLVAPAAVVRRRCGTLPDVITGIGAHDAAVLAPEYTLISSQRGVLTTSAWPHGAPPTGTEWLAARRDLAPELLATVYRATDGGPTAPG